MILIYLGLWFVIRLFIFYVMFNLLFSNVFAPWQIECGFFNANFYFFLVATLIIKYRFIISQNYPEDPFGETWVGSIWLF